MRLVSSRRSGSSRSAADSPAFAKTCDGEPPDAATNSSTPAAPPARILGLIVDESVKSSAQYSSGEYGGGAPRGGGGTSSYRRGATIERGREPRATGI